MGAVGAEHQIGAVGNLRALHECGIRERFTDERFRCRLRHHRHGDVGPGGWDVEAFQHIRRRRRIRLHPVIACEGGDEDVEAGLGRHDLVLIRVPELVDPIPCRRHKLRQHRRAGEVEIVGEFSVGGEGAVDGVMQFVNVGIPVAVAGEIAVVRREPRDGDHIEGASAGVHVVLPHQRGHRDRPPHRRRLHADPVLVGPVCGEVVAHPLRLRSFPNLPHPGHKPARWCDDWRRCVDAGAVGGDRDGAERHRVRVDRGVLCRG